MKQEKAYFSERLVVFIVCGTCNESLLKDKLASYKVKKIDASYQIPSNFYPLHSNYP